MLSRGQRVGSGRKIACDSHRVDDWSGWPLSPSSVFMVVRKLHCCTAAAPCTPIYCMSPSPTLCLPRSQAKDVQMDLVKSQEELDLIRVQVGDKGEGEGSLWRGTM